MLDQKPFSFINKLRYVKQCAPSVFGKIKQKNLLHAFDKFAEDLVASDTTKLSESSLSRALNTDALHTPADRTPGELLIERALTETPDLRRWIEEGLGLSGLFACEGAHEIDELLKTAESPTEAKTHGFSHHNPSVLMLEVPETHTNLASMRAPFPLYGSTEEKTARELTKALIAPAASFVHWDAEPWSGASLIVRALADRPGLRKHYNAIVMVRASNVDDGHRVELAQLADVFGLNASQGELPLRLAETLRTRRTLLVVCDACNLPEGNFADHHPIRVCINAILDAREANDPAPLLTIGRSAAVAAISGRRHEYRQLMTVSDRLNEFFKVSPGKRFDEFRAHWNRYRIQRGLKGAEYGGTRLKRAKWHYEASPVRSNENVWPANLRMRAYFASNPASYSPFDPTAGFEALCGDNEMPEDIRQLHDDIASYLQRIARPKRKSELRGLRHCSTAVHWLSREGAAHLSNGSTLAGRRGIVVHRVSPDTLDKVAKNPDTPVLLCPPLQGKRESSEPAQSVFVVGLGIRAIVQDHWRQEDPIERAFSHFHVAKRLKDMEHERELLESEFPYAAHRGRNRLYFLAETIRHLMRACGTASGPFEAHDDKDPTDRWRDFPDVPQTKYQGCDPADVVNYAFAELYQRQINRNTSFARTDREQPLARALAKQHGAFQLAAELLQLMSEGGRIGSPHRALHPAFRPTFIRECGFALLDLGELEEAETCFQRGFELDDLEPEHRIQALLDIALVQAERDKVDKAWKSLDQAVYFAGPNPADSQKRRIAMRRAHLAYLANDLEGSMEIIKTLDRRSHDLEHVRIAIEGRQSQRLDALAADITHKFSELEYASHEKLGYRIALAHAQRKQGLPDSAETTLNSILNEMLAYGCSERTLLRWLLESARTLAAQGRLVRGYAAYARPCAIRARDKGFHRIARTAAILAQGMLELIIQKVEDPNIPSKVWRDYIERARQNEKRHVNNIHKNTDTKSRRKHMPNYADPLFGYFLVEESNVIDRLAKPEGLQEEILKMTLLLSELPEGSPINSDAYIQFDPERIAT